MSRAIAEHGKPRGEFTTACGAGVWMGQTDAGETTVDRHIPEDAVAIPDDVVDTSI